MLASSTFSGLTLIGPNTLFLILLLGIALFIIEAAMPHTLLPGTIGFVLTILAVIGLNAQNASMTGIALMLGGLTITALPVFHKDKDKQYIPISAAIISIMAAIITMKPTDHFSLEFTLAFASATAAGLFLLGHKIGELTNRSSMLGKEAMIGQKGKATTDINKESGRVRVNGVFWEAYADHPISAKTKIKVIDINGLRLKVEEAEPETYNKKSTDRQ